jgi:hypothetical protein
MDDKKINWNKWGAIATGSTLLFLLLFGNQFQGLLPIINDSGILLLLEKIVSIRVDFLYYVLSILTVWFLSNVLNNVRKNKDISKLIHKQMEELGSIEKSHHQEIEKLKSQIKSSKENGSLSFFEYLTDTYMGLVWDWKWFRRETDGKYYPENLKVFCSKCGSVVDKKKIQDPKSLKILTVSKCTNLSCDFALDLNWKTCYSDAKNYISNQVRIKYPEEKGYMIF